MSLSPVKLRPDSEVLQLTLSYRLLLFFAAILAAMAADLHNCAAGGRRRRFRLFGTPGRKLKIQGFSMYYKESKGPAPWQGSGAGVARRPSICLASEESRDIELILLSRIMHRCCATMGIQTLRCRPAGIFGDRLGRPAFRLPCRRRLHWKLILRHGPCGPGHGRRRRGLRLRPPANPD